MIDNHTSVEYGHRLFEDNFVRLKAGSMHSVAGSKDRETTARCDAWIIVKYQGAPYLSAAQRRQIMYLPLLTLTFQRIVFVLLDVGFSLRSITIAKGISGAVRAKAKLSWLLYLFSNAYLTWIHYLISTKAIAR